MDREDEELLHDLESDLNSTAVALNASEVVRVNVGVGMIAVGVVKCWRSTSSKSKF